MTKPENKLTETRERRSGVKEKKTKQNRKQQLDNSNNTELKRNNPAGNKAESVAVLKRKNKCVHRRSCFAIKQEREHPARQCFEI